LEDLAYNHVSNKNHEFNSITIANPKIIMNKRGELIIKNKRGELKERTWN